jgi:type 1 glutamine amidotransferase/HEAT repeat protein
MKRTFRFACAILFSFSAVAAENNQPTPEQIALIKEALPTKARVEPTSERRLLVFTLCKGFVHSCIPVAAKAMQMMGEATGAYTADISDDPEVFTAERLAQYDAILFDNTTGSLFQEEEKKEALLNFIKSGKGIVGVHASTDSFTDWPEYGVMIGGYFNGHPWNATELVGVQLEDPGHALSKCFKGSGFLIKDEIYQIKDPYNRNQQHVLLGLDHERTDFNKPGQLKRADNDYAISWVKKYGEGRVFYCSLGHNEHVFWNPKVMRYYLDGIQFAMGDLEADTTPSAALSPEYIAASKTRGDAMVIPGLIEEITTFNMGDHADAVTRMEKLVLKAQGNEANINELNEAFASLINDPEATLDGKQFACRQLYLIGNDMAVPALGEALLSSETCDMARYALERMGSSKAELALIDALDKSGPNIRIGLANSLGQMKSKVAASKLGELAMLSSHTVVIDAATKALGAIGPKEELEKLPTLQAQHALISVSDQLRVEGKNDEALQICQRIFNSAKESEVRAVAMRGLALCQGVEAVPMLMEALKSGDRIMVSTAANTLREIPGEEATVAIANGLPSLESDAQILVIYALADRKDSACLDTALTLIGKNEDVDVAFVQLVGIIGGPDQVADLLQFATGDSDALADAANASLAKLPQPEINAVLAGLLKGEAPAMQTVILDALKNRNATESVEAVMELAAKGDDVVRVAAFQALAALGSNSNEAEAIKLLCAEKAEGPRDAAEDTVASLAKGDAQNVLAAYPATASMTEARLSLIRALGDIADDSAVSTLVQSMHGGGEAEQMEAVDVLSRWSSPAPIDELLAATEKNGSDANKRTALQGAIRQIALESNRSPAQTVALYAQAAALATENDDIAMILAGIAEVIDPSVMPLIKQYKGREGLENDVKEAIERAACAQLSEQNLVPILKGEGFMVDSALDEWRRFNTVLKENTIKASFRIEWTDEALWFAVEVFDHSSVTGGDAMDMWGRDSITIGIDPLNEKPEGWPANGIEVGFELTEEPSGQFYAWNLPPGTDSSITASIKSSVKRVRNLTTYEIGIPWEVLLPLQPAAEKQFGLNIGIIDTDEGDTGGRRVTQWTPGLINGRNASMYHTCILMGEL